MSELEQQAKALAAREYIEAWYADETTNGEPGYIALSPELPGCLGSGGTPDAARADLSEARYEYILSLLQDGLPVPAPMCGPNATIEHVSYSVGASRSTIFTIDFGARQ